MWSGTSDSIEMVEGDYGIGLDFNVSGATLSANDTLRFTFKTAKNGETILVKEYTPTDNKVSLVFTDDESALFPVGKYAYALDWYQNGSFLGCMIHNGKLKVVDKV